MEILYFAQNDKFKKARNDKYGFLVILNLIQDPINNHFGFPVKLRMTKK